MMIMNGSHSASVVLAAFLVFGLTACEEMVDTANTTDFGFTMYGIFNPATDSQAVRIFPIEALLDVTRPEPIDAIVNSIDLTTGEGRAWQDSLTQFSNGEFGHVFWSPFRAEHEHRYRLEVLRSDGVRAEVTTTVPPYTEPEVQEPDTGVFALIAPVSWVGAPRLIDIRVTYFSNVGNFVRRYGTEQETVGDAQVVNVEFRADTREIFLQAAFSRVSPVVLSRVKIEAVVASDDWIPPGGVFDRNVQVEPGTFSNVTNGFGFVGAGYETSVIWVPSDEVLKAAHFFVETG